MRPGLGDPGVTISLSPPVRNGVGLNVVVRSRTKLGPQAASCRCYDQLLSPGTQG